MVLEVITVFLYVKIYDNYIQQLNIFTQSYQGDIRIQIIFS